MSTFQRAEPALVELANSILCEHASHKPLLDAKARIEYVMAYADLNEDGEQTGHALVARGCRLLGYARKMPLKDRAMGRADAEVTLDGDWWKDASEPERKALLDHELHHLTPKLDKDGALILDDLNRPKIALRKHDFEFGWFTAVAERNGAASLERRQAKQILDSAGQYYFPNFVQPSLLPA